MKKQSILDYEFIYINNFILYNIMDPTQFIGQMQQSTNTTVPSIQTVPVAPEQQMPVIRPFDIQQVKEAYKIIVSALNKSAKSGAFNIDEGYLIKLATIQLDKVMDYLEK